MTALDAQQILLIEHACSKLILRVAAFADAGHATRLAALFTTDGVLVRPSAAPVEGRQAIEASYAERPTNRITRHLITNTLVDVESASRAQAVSLVLLWSASADDEPDLRGRRTRGPQVVGEFHDTLALTDEGWRIARREARFLMHAPS
jgi:ketosteroid isomerase-like protein